MYLLAICICFAVEYLSCSHLQFICHHQASKLFIHLLLWVCLFVCWFVCPSVCVCHRHNSSCGTMWSLDRMIWIYSQRAIGHIAGMCATLAPNPNPHLNLNLNLNPHGHPHVIDTPPRLGQWQWEINIIEKRFQACALLSLYLFIHSVNFCGSAFSLTELIISPHKFFGLHFPKFRQPTILYRKWKMTLLYSKLWKNWIFARLYNTIQLSSVVESLIKSYRRPSFSRKIMCYQKTNEL